MEIAASALPTPLCALHIARGASLGTWFGCVLPSDFGDWRAEYDFAQKSVALIDKNYRAYFSLTGPDRVRYLNAVLTNDIKSLTPGQGNVSLLLNPQGRILAEIETHAEPERLLCISFAMTRKPLLEVIEKFIIMDDVTLTDESDRYATLALEGPQITRLVSELVSVDLAKLDDFASVAAGIGSLQLTVTKKTYGGVPSAEFLVDQSQTETLWNIVLERVKAAGGGPAGYTALNTLRLEQGIPWFGYDFGDKQIPHEAGLEGSHISYSKGCYTGQEIVERVRSRGQVNRRRVLLAFSGTKVPEPNDTLISDGKEVGHVTRSAFSPRFSQPIAMAYVRKESAGQGNELKWKDEVARIIAPML
jgi:folate-binding protein YgfZ